MTNLVPTVTVEVRLGNPTPGAIDEFRRAVEGYAEALRVEAEKQALGRPSGMLGPEVSAEAVAIAKNALKKWGERAKPTIWDIVSYFGVPISTCAVGVLASHTNSAWQNGCLTGSIFCGIVFLGSLAKRRLLLL